MTVKTSPGKRPGRPKRPSLEQESSGLTTQTIFAKTLALIDERGLANFNIRGPATALGVSPAAVYWHVPNRSAPLDALEIVEQTEVQVC
jgi:AcrR family transcriptional regulator